MFALSLPPGQGVINELAHEGPYHHGVFRDQPNPKEPTGVTCPYCKAEVLRYEYPEFGFCLLICKEIGVFMRLPAGRLSLENWARMVRQPARAWTEVEANEKGGARGGRN
jgi:hypothetical protein